MPPVSVVIPYRSDGGQRDRIMDWVMRRYKACLPESSEVVLGLEKTPSEYFRRAEAINNGVEQARWDTLLIADSDAVYFQDALEQAAAAVHEHQDFGWAIPYDWYYMLDEASTQRVLAMEPTTTDFSWGWRSIFSTDTSNASLAVVTKRNFYAVGGFDELFIAWGPEDQVWAAAVTTLCGPPLRLEGRPCFHLHHPVNPAHRTGNPHYQAALTRWDAYKAAEGNPAAMREVLGK